MFTHNDNFYEAWDDLLFGRGTEDESYEDLQGLHVRPSDLRQAEKEGLFKANPKEKLND